MPVYEITRRAPEDQNSLAGYERRGLGASLDPNFQFSGGGAPPTGSEPIPSIGEKTKEEPSWLDNINTFLQSDATQGLIQTGIQTYQAREDRIAAEEAAKRAEEQSRLRTLAAQQEAAATRGQMDMAAQLREQQLAIQRAQAERAAALARQGVNVPAAQGGMPSWVIPAVAIGGAGLLAIVLLGRRKRA